MVRSEKRLKELAQALKRENTLVISAAVKNLRDEEPFEGAIGLLADCYNETSSLSVKNIIRDFMNDIKDPSLRKEVIDEIKKVRLPATVTMLVSSCWQSGLDYSGYSSDIAKVFITGDYATALECFTVIEESAHNLSRESKNEILALLSEKAQPLSDEKAPLTREFIKLMKE